MKEIIIIIPAYAVSSHFHNELCRSQFSRFVSVSLDHCLYADNKFYLNPSVTH